MADKVKIIGKKVLEELKAPALIVIGIAAGSITGKMIDKVLKVDGTTEGFNAKALARPILQLTAGVGGAILLKNENLKLFATGVAASGVASSVKVLLKKDILSGFEGLGTTEAMNHFRQNLKLERYNPNLPELVNETKVQEVPIEIGNPVNYSEYEEVDQIEIL